MAMDAFSAGMYQQSVRTPGRSFMSSVRLGIWGIGSHVQRNIVPAIDRSFRTQLVALHTRNEEVLDEVAAATGARACREVEDLLSAPDVDVIYIAAPTGLHAEMGIAAIGAGKHVWCEKPMTASLAQTTDLIDAALSAGLVALESDMFLHHPQFTALRRLVESEQVGQVISITGRFGFPHLPRSDFRYSKEMGGGALLDAGFYPVAAATALLGPGLTLAGSSVAVEQGGGVDVGGAALATTGGRAALLDWGFGRGYRNEIEVWCEGGFIEVQRAFSKPANLETRIDVFPQSGDAWTVPIAAADHFALMLDHFVSITTGEETYDPQQMLARARLLDAVATCAT